MATKALDIVVGAEDRASAVFEKVSASLKKLKTATGEESTFGGFAKVFAGTGAVAGLALASRELKSMTDLAGRLAEEYQAGQKSARDVAAELAHSIPIAGELASSIENIGALLNGTAADIARINKESKNAAAFVDTVLAAQDRMRKERLQAANEIRDIRDRTNLLGLVDPTKTLVDLDQQRVKLQRELAQQSEESAKSIRKGYDTQIQDLQQQYASAAQKAGDAQAELARAQQALAETREADRRPGQFYDVDQAKKAVGPLVDARDRLNSQLKALRDQREKEVAQHAQVLSAKELAQEAEFDAKRKQVEDQANQERERRELTHWQTMNTIRVQAQAQALQDEGKTVAASIAQLQADYRAAEAAAQQKFRESFREAMQGGPLSPAEVGANEAEEAAGRKSAFGEAVRRAVGEGVGKGILSGFDAAADKVQSIQASIVAQWRRTWGTAGLPSPRDAFQSPGFSLPNLQPVGGLTGIANAFAERFNAGADPLVDAAKKAEKQRQDALKKQDDTINAILSLRDALGAAGTVGANIDF